jgi:hypothetical protein
MIPVGGEGVAPGETMPTLASQGVTSVAPGSQPMQINGASGVELGGGRYTQMMGLQVRKISSIP